MKTSRRNFLGAVAASPVAVAAPVAMAMPTGTSGPDELIARYEHFRALSNAASEKVDELYQSPGKPEKTFVRLGEVDIGERGPLGNRSEFRWPEDIDAYYAKVADTLEWQFANRACSRAHYVGRKAAIPTACAAANSLLAERKAAHCAWEARFGIPAALAESDRLCEIEVELDNAIAAWPISTLEEARLVAGHILRSHADSDLDGDVEQFLRNVAGETV